MPSVMSGLGIAGGGTMPPPPPRDRGCVHAPAPSATPGAGSSAAACLPKPEEDLGGSLCSGPPADAASEHLLLPMRTTSLPAALSTADAAPPTAADDAAAQ